MNSAFSDAQMTMITLDHERGVITVPPDRDFSGITGYTFKTLSPFVLKMITVTLSNGMTVGPAVLMLLVPDPDGTNGTAHFRDTKMASFSLSTRDISSIRVYGSTIGEYHQFQQNFPPVATGLEAAVPENYSYIAGTDQAPAQQRPKAVPLFTDDPGTIARYQSAGWAVIPIDTLFDMAKRSGTSGIGSFWSGLWSAVSWPFKNVWKGAKWVAVQPVHGFKWVWNQASRMFELQPEVQAQNPPERIEPTVTPIIASIVSLIKSPWFVIGSVGAAYLMWKSYKKEPLWPIVPAKS